MNTLQHILIALVALIHFYILVLEMVLWTKPKGIKTFGIKSKQFAEDTKVLAANQGLYNGFLALGLIYSIIIRDHKVAILFLSFVVIAGLYGAYSTKKIRIFYVQSVPAILALLSLIIS